MSTDTSNELAAIERQIEKLESTATNLETLAVLATDARKSVHAKALADQAVQVRLQQFRLYRKKHRLLVASNEWKALIAAMELVNHFLEEAIDDLEKVTNVLTSVANLIDVATKLATLA